MVWSQEIVQVTNDVNQLRTSVDNTKTALDNAVASTESSKGISANNALIAANSAIRTAASANTASSLKDSVLSVYPTMSAANNAVVVAQGLATNAVTAASTASLALPQDLSGINAAALHRSPNAITAMFVYDTSKDSDGGAWTEKCQHTSWWNESLSGRWLGAQPSEINARYEGAVLGEERVTNGDFTTNTSWTTTNVNIANGVAALIGTSTYKILFQNLATIADGTLCRVTYTVATLTTSGTVRVRIDNSNGQNRTVSAPGTYTEYLVKNGVGTLAIESTGSNTFVGSIDNVSVRAVTALTTATGDYYQSTADGRFYRLWKNLFSWPEDLSQAVWNATESTKTASTLTASTTGTFRYVRQNRTIQQNERHTVSGEFKAGTSNFVWLLGQTSTDAFALFNLSTGQYVSAFGGGGSPESFSITPVGDGWYRCSATWVKTTASGIEEVGFGLSDGTNSAVTAGASIQARRLQVELGSLTAYEAKAAEGSVSEVFRGNKRDFPRLAAIVAEGANVTIYDLTEPGRPMWMRFWQSDGLDWFTPFLGGLANRNRIQAIHMLNGVFAVSGPAEPGSHIYGHLRLASFADDVMSIYVGGYNYRGRSNVGISERNATTVGFGPLGGGMIIPGAGLPDGRVNAVAMTVLPDAPVDPVTGLRVPTIAVATNGGVSVIKHNGTVVSSAAFVAETVTISPYALTAARGYGNSDHWVAFNPGGLATGFAMGSSFSNQFDASGFTSRMVARGRASFLKATASRVAMRVLNDSMGTIGRHLSALLASTFNTGWMTGDIRRCILSDTEVGGLPRGEIGWPSGTLSVSNFLSTTGYTLTDLGDRIRIERNATSYVTFPTLDSGLVVPNVPYSFEFEILAVSSGATAFYAATNGGAAQLIGNDYPGTGRFRRTATPTGAGNGTARFSFAPARSASPANALTGDFIEISKTFNIVRAVSDRSYRNVHQTVFGTLTRAQLASGTSLVGYSGFSAANYLREPYSADLDFGTGEWTGSAWVNIPATLPLSNFPVTGPNLVTNGGFDADTNWTKGTGISISGGSLVFSSAAVPQAASQTGIALKRGFAYLVTIDAAITTGSDIRVRIGNATDVLDVGVANGSNSRVIAVPLVPNNDNWSVSIFGANGPAVTATFDNLSIVELGPAAIFDRAAASGPRLRLGVDAAGRLTATAFNGTTTRTVTTSAAYNAAQWLKARVNYTTDGTLAILVNGREVAATRGTPLLSLNSRYNLLTYSQDFTNAVWVKTVTLGSTTETAPDGTATATVVSNTSDYQSLRFNLALTGDVVTSVAVRKTTGATHFPGLSVQIASTYRSIALNTNTGVATPRSSEPVPVGEFGVIDNGTFWRVWIRSSGLNSVYIYPRVNTDAGATWTGGNGSQVFWGAQIENATTPRTYQRITTATDFDFQAPLTIGNSFALNAPFPGSIALLKLSATVPTQEQESFMYEQEKQLFRAGAISVLPDSSSIVDMSYDDATDRWVAVSASNESYWTGLVRSSVTPVSAGTYSRVVTNSGVELVARATTNPGVDVTIPPYGLREELVKRAESASRLSRQITIYDFVGGFTASTTNGSTAITSVANLTYPTSYIGARISGSGIPANTTITGVSGTTIYISAPATATATGVTVSFLDFILPVGMEARVVMSAGLIRREGSTADYARLYDGFRETIRFATAPGNTAWVQIQATRTPQ